MISQLPLSKPIETQKVLKKAISANRALANLNGVARIIPNSAILINSLVLQEAKDSSEIENIITTHDELYRANLDIGSVSNEAKEEQNYKEALLRGFALVEEHKLLLGRHIIEIQSVLERNNAGVRRQAGTNLKNAGTGIEFLVDRLHITRQTASKYLIELENIGILKNIQIKNSKYYINIELFAMLKKGI